MDCKTKFDVSDRIEAFQRSSRDQWKEGAFTELFDFLANLLQTDLP